MRIFNKYTNILKILIIVEIIKKSLKELIEEHNKHYNLKYEIKAKKLIILYIYQI